jgi:CheY-like chemotaxis protein
MVSGSGDSSVEILLVEDNPADARLAQDTIEQSERNANITHAEDGEIALSILRKEGEHSDAPTPDLILLDLRMPNKDGTQVLAEMSQDANLSSIPVMLLTGTQAEASLLESYAIPASRYVRKPLQLEQLERVLGQLDSLGRRPIQMPWFAPQESASSGKKRRWWWPFG